MMTLQRLGAPLLTVLVLAVAGCGEKPKPAEEPGHAAAPLGGFADIHQHSLAGCHLLRGFGRGELGDFRCRDGEQGGDQGGEQESGKAK